MATTIEQVCGYLNDLGVSVSEVDRDNEQILFFLSPLNLSLRCYINLRSEGKYIVVTCYPEIVNQAPLAPLRREQVLERLNAFNCDFIYGRWGLGDNEEPRVTFPLHLEDAALTHRQIWSVIFILKDLVILQAQSLQLLIGAGIQAPVEEALLSGIAISAALGHPSRVAEIAHVLCLQPAAAHALHELVGETATVQDEEVECPRLLLN
ncbi:MAG: hypothetical protein K0Q68_304 [Moraxellaceae bacterium]|jgi:hypothetical protein|nr:hypothetical protein [Moraxellaceae bacterium]